MLIRAPRLTAGLPPQPWVGLRRRLIRDTWGAALPSHLPHVEADYQGTSAAATWPNDAPRADRLTCQTVAGGASVVHLVYPAAVPAISGVQRGAVVLVHGGHSDPYYSAATRSAFLTLRLLQEGYHVLGLSMPTDAFNVGQMFDVGAGPIPIENHDFSPLEPAFQPLRAFLDGGIVATNHCVSMGLRVAGAVGISGGGWTVDQLAATDLRIRLVCNVFGSVPFPMRNASGGPGQDGDWEQLGARSWWTTLVDYDRVYTLACLEKGRRRVQYLGTGDPVFPAGAITTELAALDHTIRGRVAGSHEIRVDTTATDHHYSDETIAAIVADIKATS